MSTAEQNDKPPPQPAPKPKANKGAAGGAAKNASSSSSASSSAPVFLVRADVKERKKPPPNLAVVMGGGKEDDSATPSVLEADGVIASLEASPSVGDVTSALDTCMEQALRLISVPGRIYSEPALDAYR